MHYYPFTKEQTYGQTTSSQYLGCKFISLSLRDGTLYIGGSIKFRQCVFVLFFECVFKCIQRISQRAV